MRHNSQPIAHDGPIEIKYPIDDTLPLVSVPRDNNTRVEPGWVVTGEGRDEAGNGYYTTEYPIPVMDENGINELSKNVAKHRLEELNPSLVERYASLSGNVGGHTLHALGIEPPMNANNPDAPVQAEQMNEKSDTDVINDQLDALNEGLSDSDKRALWRFGTSLHQHEMQSALDSMSDELRKDPLRYYGYQDLIRKRTQLRSK